MRAVVQAGYGLTSLQVHDVEKPTPGPGDVLVRVHASSVNKVDWYGVSGLPLLFRPLSGFRKPRQTSVGSDFAGTIEAIGDHVTRFKLGDAVFGAKSGAYADYVCVPEGGPLTQMPVSVGFAEAAGVPVAGVTALQAVRDKGHVEPGQRVLINGASGGVGTFAVQIAKSFGSEVTGVCGARNVEMVRSLGADHVIDYSREDFAATGILYDVMVDIAGGRPWPECRRVLVDNGIYVLVGASNSNRWLGPLGHIVRQRLASLLATQKFRFFAASVTQPDLAFLGHLMEKGELRTVIDRAFPLSAVAQAVSCFEHEHARGKILIDMSPARTTIDATSLATSRA